MFNLKKYAKANPTTPFAKQLEEKRDEFNQKEPSEGTTERQLAAGQHKEKDTSVPFNEQLGEVRVGTATANTEGQLNKSPKVFNEKRDDHLYSKSVTAPNLAAEGHNQEKLKAFRKAQEGQDRDTEFWDKFVGSQMIGEKTKIVSNNQKSQLQNKDERFKGVTPSVGTNKKFNELIVASLSHADKMLFHIFATAAREGRKISQKEQQQITDINSGKARIIASYEKSNVKTAQFFDDDEGGGGWPGDGSGTDDLADYNQNEADDYRNEGLDSSPTYNTFSIRPDENGFNIVTKTFNEETASFEEAKLAGPFATPELAHDYAAKSPELDDYEYQEEDGTVETTPEVAPEEEPSFFNDAESELTQIMPGTSPVDPVASPEQTPPSDPVAPQISQTPPKPMF